MHERLQRGVEERGDHADFANLVKALHCFGNRSDAYCLALLVANQCGSDAARKED